MPEDLVKRLRDDAEFMAKRFKVPLEMSLPHKAADRIEDLADILLAVEMLTATGEGLSPDETIAVHLLAARGRADDPAAWMASAEQVARIRAALRTEEKANG
jgi:hypothetical protein